MREITIAPLVVASAAHEAAAQWRYDAFLKSYRLSVAESAAQLTKLASAPEHGEAALIAHVDGKPAGVCLLVSRELEDLHDLTPWLASLYVAPEFRGLGIARRLITAIEEQARAAGFSTLYLYTDDAQPVYEKCGWTVREQLRDDAGPYVLMERNL